MRRAGKGGLCAEGREGGGCNLSGLGHAHEDSGLLEGGQSGLSIVDVLADDVLVRRGAEIHFEILMLQLCCSHL